MPKTFGQIISERRKELKISQKDLAEATKKEDGASISPQYLNDIEHDRRDPPSEFIIGQLAKQLKLKQDYVTAAAGLWPQDIRDVVGDAGPKKVEEAMTAFRRVLKDKG